MLLQESVRALNFGDQLTEQRLRADQREWQDYPRDGQDKPEDDQGDPQQTANCQRTHTSPQIEVEVKIAPAQS